MAQNSIIIPTTAPLPGISLVNDVNNANISLATQFSGGSAPTAAGLGLAALSGVWWHDTSTGNVNIRDQADTAWILVGTINETTKTFTPANAGGSGGGGGGGGGASVASGLPCGRLTATSGSPIVTADVAGGTAVYYTPYQGNTVPIYSGTVFNTFAFSELTLSLTASAHLSGKLYDVFVASNSGSVVVGTGPAWTSTSARGTGAGTTDLTRLGGILTNTQVMTLTNGSTTYSSIPVNQCTYVGTIYATANGQTSMIVNPSAASGGNNSILGIYNYYNRVRVTTHSSDSTATWTYATSTWRPSNGSTNNRISWVDGRATSSVSVQVACLITGSSSSAGGLTGIGINNTITPSGIVGNWYGQPYGVANGWWVQSPIMGFNYAQFLENDINASVTFNGGSLNHQICMATEL